MPKIIRVVTLNPFATYSMPDQGGNAAWIRRSTDGSEIWVGVRDPDARSTGKIEAALVVVIPMHNVACFDMLPEKEPEPKKSMTWIERQVGGRPDPEAAAKISAALDDMGEEV